MLDCILFDLDGLLVDSEPLQFRAYRRAFAQYGIALELDDWIRWHSVEASTRRWVENEKLDVDVDELRQIKKDYYEELIAETLTLKPGAADLVDECTAHFRLAVVSASRRESIEACLGKFGLLEHFSTYVSGAEAARSKPYPDPYLAAIEKLDTRAESAIALEDSVTGYRAASAAGIKCIVCPDHFIPKPATAFDQAEVVVETLHDLCAQTLRSVHAAP
jgi:HAD superfamily hydrolase (TIGR01509 family)